MELQPTRLDAPSTISQEKTLIGRIISCFKGRRSERAPSFAPSRIRAGNLSRPSISDLRSSATSLIRFIVSSEARHEYYLARDVRKLKKALIQFDAQWPKNIKTEVVTVLQPVSGQDIESRVNELISKPNFTSGWFEVEAKYRTQDSVKFEPQFEVIFTRTKDGAFPAAKHSCLARISDALAADRLAENGEGKAGRKSPMVSLNPLYDPTLRRNVPRKVPTISENLPID